MHDTVTHCQRNTQKHEPDVLGIPEARTACQHASADEPDEPTPPDRDLHRVAYHVGVGPEEPFQPVPYGVYVRHQDT